ncbi:hypothetical protein SteCoe_13577 [Stentor coeruleus]|uniref:G-protein coupled receptors family 1 profile domain-containing protein n=1 Tax=Stentor coeruleus TaxID=5963 RepID=A0A1R2C841_9CILI|nr:hypothetical protein SteCoe_13577 [Stentor coeruleus]
MDSYRLELQISVIILNALSISLCLFAIIIYIFAKHLRIYAFKLVFWMNLADLFRSIAQIIPVIYKINDSFCEILGIIHMFSSCLTLYWAFVIAVTIYQVLVKKILDVEKYYTYWLGFGLTICAICGIVPMLYNDYGYLLGDCTLKNNFAGLVTKFAEFYFPAFIISISNTVIFYRVYKTLKKEHELVSNKEKIDAKRLFYYPVVLIITVTPSTIDRALRFFDIESQMLYEVAGVLWTIQGILNPLCYSLTKPVKEYIMSGCKKRTTLSSAGSDLNKESILTDN